MCYHIRNNIVDETSVAIKTVLEALYFDFYTGKIAISSSARMWINCLRNIIF